jgi:hypothetical protein
MRRILLSGILPVLFILFNAGCGTTYKEPSHSDSNSALLVGIPPAWIVSIDGQKVPPLRFSREKQYRIASGQHQVAVRYLRLEQRLASELNPHPFDPTTAYHRRGPSMYVDGSMANATQYQPVETVQVRSEEDLVLKLTAVAGHTYYVIDGSSEVGWDPFISEYRDQVFLDLPTK